MFEDIASDYRHKTVTIEKLPFTSNTTSVSIHPCKHANVMKVLMRRAAAAAKERSLEHEASKMIKKISKLGINKDNDNTSVSEDEGWEGVEAVDSESQTESTTSGGGADDTGIRADQYLVVFLKFMSSVTPGIEHDYTMDAL
jgi:ubiquitin-like-conjugating enzyme ATG3